MTGFLPLVTRRWRWWREVFLDARTFERGDGFIEVRFNPLPGRTHRVGVRTT